MHDQTEHRYRYNEWGWCYTASSLLSSEGVCGYVVLLCRGLWSWETCLIRWHVTEEGEHSDPSVMELFTCA